MSKWEMVCVYTAGTVAQVCGAGQDVSRACWSKRSWCVDGGWTRSGSERAGVAVLRDRSEESSAGREKREEGQGHTRLYGRPRDSSRTFSVR
jgi:hypothetical protein